MNSWKLTPRACVIWHRVISETLLVPRSTPQMKLRSTSLISASFSWLILNSVRRALMAAPTRFRMFPSLFTC